MLRRNRPSERADQRVDDGLDRFKRLNRRARDAGDDMHVAIRNMPVEEAYASLDPLGERAAARLGVGVHGADWQADVE